MDFIAKRQWKFVSRAKNNAAGYPSKHLTLWDEKPTYDKVRECFVGKKYLSYLELKGFEIYTLKLGHLRLGQCKEITHPPKPKFFYGTAVKKKKNKNA